MNDSLTVILPIHNAEATLRRNLLHLLDVVADLTPRFELLVFDDGSTDDSFDIASELAAEYPQVRVGRHSRRRGMGPTLQNARQRATGNLVIVHDGVNTVNAEQLNAVWRAHLAGAESTEATINDLRLPARTQAAMEAAHRRVAGFRLMPGTIIDASGTLEVPASAAAASSKPRTDRPAAGIGSIPVLPRPNFMGAVANFAFGE